MVKPLSRWVGHLVVMIVLAGGTTACAEQGKGPPSDGEANATRKSPPAADEGSDGDDGGGSGSGDRLRAIAEQVKAQVSVSIAALREGAFDAAYLFEQEEFQSAVSPEEYVRVHTACAGGLDDWVVKRVRMIGPSTASVTHVYGLDFATTDQFDLQDGRWRWPVRNDEMQEYLRGGADYVIEQQKRAGICTPALGNGLAWSCPNDRPVKGNVSFRTKERIYHLPGSWLYPVTSPDECFPDAASAEHAGYRAARD
jgi:hypothetical protein